MNAIAPTEFVQIGLQADAFHRQDSRSWRGPCPTCGGHRRFVIFTDNDFPLWHGWCDDCGYKVKYWEHHQPNRLPTDVELEARRIASQRAREERQKWADAKLARFTDEELWAELHKRMGEPQRAWWRQQGIPDSVQDYLELGWMAHRPYNDGGELRYSDAFTIPYFHNGTDGRQFQTMQYRLTAPANPADRYRFEAGMQATYYHTTPDQPLEDRVIICEGAKKAIVVSLLAPADVTVLAVPSKSSTSWFGLPDYIGERRAYVILDPDAGQSAAQLCRALGGEARLVSLFDKVDDLINAHGFDRRDLAAALRQAVKP